VITLFTTAKPFKGHIGIIQRNALQSWKMLGADVEIILFGNDEGTAEVCAEFGLRHEPNVARSAGGAIRLDDMFGKAQSLARHDLLCYVNCDIILLEDFLIALQLVRSVRSKFLAVGRRWDTNITAPIDFSSHQQGELIRKKALESGRWRSVWWIDYFVFSRGFYGGDLPPFAVGRSCWDNWLVWKGVVSGDPVIDLSAAVAAVHQNHDYNHIPGGKREVWQGQDAQRNSQLCGGSDHFCSIREANLVLNDKGLRPNYLRHWAALLRFMLRLGHFVWYRMWKPMWFLLLDATRPVRSALGLRSAASQRKM
jgi:hypothetical protein